jgi:hypothetical protein
MVIVSRGMGAAIITLKQATRKKQDSGSTPPPQKNSHNTEDKNAVPMQCKLPSRTM